jgi:hypothetical protein
MQRRTLVSDSLVEEWMPLFDEAVNATTGEATRARVATVFMVRSLRNCAMMAKIFDTFFKSDSRGIAE